MICKKLYRKRSWHATDNCEDSNKILIRQFRKMRKLNSNFFNMHGVVRPAQKVIANRNWSSSSFFRLPPEIRGRIYAIVFGGEKVHVGRTDNRINWKSKNQLNWKKRTGCETEKEVDAEKDDGEIRDYELSSWNREWCHVKLGIWNEMKAAVGCRRWGIMN